MLLLELKKVQVQADSGWHGATIHIAPGLINPTCQGRSTALMELIEVGLPG
ncbi:MAG TPA: hypothetical protein VGJ60_36885 [Chloroflexota bacterium]